MMCVGMYVCMWVGMFVWILYLRSRYVCVRMYACMYACMHVCMYVFMYSRSRYVYICVYLFMDAFDGYDD